MSEILIENGRARGVVLRSGEVIRAKNVIGAVDPTTLMSKMVDQQYVPMQTQEEVRGLQSLRNNLYTFKIDAALSKRPEYPNHDLSNPHAVGRTDGLPVDGLPASVHGGGHERRVRPRDRAADGGTVDRRPDVGARGQHRGQLHLYASNTPVKLSDYRDWAVEGKAYVDACLDQYEQYAPGFKDSILDIHHDAG